MPSLQFFFRKQAAFYTCKLSLVWVLMKKSQQIGQTCTMVPKLSVTTALQFWVSIDQCFDLQHLWGFTFLGQSFGSEVQPYSSFGSGRSCVSYYHWFFDKLQVSAQSPWQSNLQALSSGQFFFNFSYNQLALNFIWFFVFFANKVDQNSPITTHSFNPVNLVK